MIFPLFVEQFLLMLVGLTDTLIVSYAGEARSQYIDSREPEASMREASCVCFRFCLGLSATGELLALPQEWGLT